MGIKLVTNPENQLLKASGGVKFTCRIKGSGAPAQSAARPSDAVQIDE